MTIRVAINGFGRIGRLVCRLAIANPNLKVVAINDLSSADHLAYLLKYDSVHGIYPDPITFNEHFLEVGTEKIAIFNKKDPTDLNWQELEVDVVVECTGAWTHLEECLHHVQRGAKRVLLTAPGKDQIPTYVMGVNHTQYNPQKDLVFSNASCTTNCLAPLAKVIDEAFGVEEGLMTTVHAATSSQKVVDGVSPRDYRAGRSVLQNIIPSSTGAAQSVISCLPHLKGKLTGMAFRVPVADVSVVDLTVRTQKKTSYDAIAQAMQAASEGCLKGILSCCDDEVVSSDFLGSPFSAIFDRRAGIALNDSFFKIIAWYDNEAGYAHRVLDLLMYAHQKSLTNGN